METALCCVTVQGILNLRRKINFYVPDFTTIFPHGAMPAEYVAITKGRVVTEDGFRL
jgi:hypothetical protein